jgi:hypothetical protein
MNTEVNTETKRLSPIKAIRANCLDCMNGSSNEVKLCPIENCPLYPYRLGKNPYIAAREYTDEQRAALAERMRNLHKKSKSGNADDSENEVTEKS